MADFKPAVDTEVTFEGKTYRWVGAAWAIVNEKTGKAGVSAKKEIAEKLTQLVAPPEETKTEAKEDIELKETKTFPTEVNLADPNNSLTALSKAAEGDMSPKNLQNLSKKDFQKIQKASIKAMEAKLLGKDSASEKVQKEIAKKINEVYPEDVDPSLMDKNGKPLKGTALEVRKEKLERERQKSEAPPPTEESQTVKNEEEKQEKVTERAKSGADVSKTKSGKADYGSGTRLAQIYRKATSEGAGTFTGALVAGKERLKEKLDPRNSFGSGLMGAIGENIFGKGYDSLKSGEKDGKEGEPSQESPEDVGGDESSKAVGDDLGIIAKNSMTWAGMARDINVIRQNLVKTTNQMLKKSKVEGKGDSKKAATSADMYFLKADERESALESERNKGKTKNTSPTPAGKPEKEEKDNGMMGLITSIASWVKEGLWQVFKMIFKPSNLMKTLGKVFVIGTLIAALFSGLIDGWKAWQETGSLKEAFIAGLGGIVEFLTFGLFDKESIRSLFSKIGEFIDPVVSTISNIVTTIKDWVVNNVGIPEIKLPKIPEIGFTIPPITVFGKQIFDGKKISAGPWDLGSIGPWYPFKSNPKSSAPEISEKPKAKEVVPDSAASKALDAAQGGKTEKTVEEKVTAASTPGDVGKEQDSKAVEQKTDSIAPTKTIKDSMEEQNQAFVEKANFYQKKRDEALSTVQKIKKARDQAVKDGASPDQIQEYNDSILKAITSAGDYEKLRIETMVKAGESPVPEIKVPEELKKSADELQQAMGGATESPAAPTQMSTTPSGGESQTGGVGATRRSSFDRVQLTSPEENKVPATKEQSPSLVESLSDTDAKNVFSESASPSESSASSSSSIPESAAITPSGGESSSPTMAAGGGGSSGGQVAEASSVTPPTMSSEGGSTSVPGEALSNASSEVAEAQRMEMAATEPTIINNNASSTSTAAAKPDNKSTASVVDEIFAQMVSA